MKRTISVLAVAAALVVASAWTLFGQPKPSAGIAVTILHTNDTHGHLRPFNYPETFDRDSVLARLPARRDIGGIARRATLAQKVRKEPGRHVLLMDAGDVCDGTPFSTEYRGEADITAMNAAGYDVGCPGNHEMNNTLAQVRKLASLARYPVVCANVTTADKGESLYRPYVILKTGPVRTAVFGLLTTDARTYPAAREGLTIESPIEAARELVPKLRRQADLVIALTHLGVEVDRELAVAVDGIDAIIGGHSHTFLPTPLFLGQVPTGDRFSVNGTVIAHDFEWGALLGRLDLFLTRGSTGKWVVQRYSGRGVAVTSAVPEHKATASVIQRYWEPIRLKYGKRIGIAASDFAQKGSDRAEYNLVADAVRAYTKADIALENMGGVRSPLTRGPITFGDLVTLDPFGNTIVTLTMTGTDILTILKERRPAVSGLRYRWLRGQVSCQIEGRAMDANRSYTVATNSFFARDPLFGSAADRRDTGKARLDAVVDYIRAAGTVRPQYDGRRIVQGIADD
ncbi:MAG: bifunctional metallophosphatase/5'-nucleotidase [Chthonomonadales bacterium]|nr:bifunctional metallophosphatase/5'-nucleotidase [Chthonomonadales bacterium]